MCSQGTWQLEKLVVQYCKRSGSSKGVRCVRCLAVCFRVQTSAATRCAVRAGRSSLMASWTLRRRTPR